MTDQWRRAGSVEQTIDAASETLFRIITDVTTTGERSDEARRAEWLADSPHEAVTGARFRGHNRHGVARWSRVCEVVEMVPDRVFAFRTVPERLDPSRRDSTTWRYDLVPRGGSTLVRHSYEITVMPRQPFRALYSRLLPHHKDMCPAMQQTLVRLAQQARGAARPPAPGGSWR